MRDVASLNALLHLGIITHDPIIISAIFPNTKIRQHPGTHSNHHTPSGRIRPLHSFAAFQVGLNI